MSYCTKYTYLYFILAVSFSLNLYSQDYDHWETAVFNDDQWSYLVPTENVDNNWISKDFDDSTWSTGQGGFGYEDGDDGTIIEATQSVYLRKKFNIVSSSDIAMAILHIDYDDAFVAYLNGVEIARSNIGTSGVIPMYNESAITWREAEMYSGGKPENHILSENDINLLINEGENILAIQVHNYGENSSDLSSNAFFSLAIKSTNRDYRPTPSWFEKPLSYKSHLPLLVFDTEGKEIVDEPKIMAKLKVVDHKDGTLNSHLDLATSYNGSVGIEIRGQSSKMFPKKSYSIETRDELGQGIDFPLLDMNTEEDWVLYAPYSDKSLIRNALTFKLAESLSTWQPKYKFCEVYINGDYKGVYLLIEKIKRDINRIDVNKLKPEEISGDALTGGYIFKVDKTWDLAANEYFNTYPSNRYNNARTYSYSYVYPKAENIVYQQSNYLKNKLTEFENVLNGSNFKNSDDGYTSFIDVLSFVEFMIFNELTNNVDGFRYSTYFYKQKDSDGGKIFASPLWDFNLGYGNVDYAPNNLSTEEWLYNKFGPTEGHPLHWWARMMEDDVFKRQLKDRWLELRSTELSNANINNVINQLVLELGESVDRNYERWNILGQYVWPNSYIGQTHIQEVNYLKGWITQRLRWMDSNIPYVTVLANPENINDKFKLSIYPNPVKISQNLNVDINANKYDIIELKLYDMQGKQVFSTLEYLSEQGNNTLNIELPNIKNGIYLYELSINSNTIKVDRLIINN